MSALIPWLLTVVVLAAAYPWAAWALARAPQPAGLALTLCLTLALSASALTQLMLWQAALGLSFDLWGITLPYLLLMLPGWALWRRTGAPLPRLARPQGALAWTALAVCALVGAAVLFNAVYWPFSRDDALSIYNHFGLWMYQHRTIAPLAGAATLYEAYPVLIPLTYTYAYLASGWPNEYLARLFPALLSLGCLPAAFALGRALDRPAAGWLAALLLALTPLFGAWASAGYVDLPMAFFHTLGAVFAWRLWRDNAAADALLAGLMMGLAAWTKNAGLVGMLALSLWLAWGWLRGRIGLRQVALALLAALLLAAPWYVRSLLNAGMLIAPTVWTDQAARTLTSLLGFVLFPERFGITGPLVTLGALASVWALARRTPDAPAHGLLLLWTVPYFAAWWLFASYDPRFLLLFLPPLTVIAGLWLARLWELLPPGRRRAVLPLALLALLLALPAVWRSVEYKRALARSPLMAHAEKVEQVRGAP